MEFGIGPVCRKSTFHGAAYKKLSNRARKQVNKLIHAAGLACEAGSIEDLMAAATKIEKKGFTEVADKIRDRFVAVKFERADGVTRWSWDRETKTEIDTGDVHDVLRVFTEFNRSFLNLRKERRIWGRPVKSKTRGFFWEFPVARTRDVYELTKDCFPGKIGHGSKGYFVFPVPEKEDE